MATPHARTGVPDIARSPRPMRLCLVAHLAFPALTGATEQTGGVEYQTSLLARWLAARGHLVTLVVWNEGQPPDTRVDGVRVLTVCRREAGWPGLRFFTPRWTSLRRALDAADAEVYYQNGAEYVTGQVGLWCRSHGRRFVFSSASNSDCDAALPLLPAWRERLLYKVGLNRSDCIVVQTRTQQDLLKRNFDHESFVLPMPCVETEGAPARTDLASRPRLTWIGRVCKVKRPDRLLDVAERSADLRFDLVGLQDGSAYAQDVLARARRLPNVEVHGVVSRQRIDALLRESACLCNTSDIEGFPNTFLEAWSHGVPVVSTFDPDRIIQEHRLGWIAAPEGFADRLRAVLADPNDWTRASVRARQHYLAHHTVEAVMPRFERLFADVLTGRHV